MFSEVFIYALVQFLTKCDFPYHSSLSDKIENTLWVNYNFINITLIVLNYFEVKRLHVPMQKWQ